MSEMKTKLIPATAIDYLVELNENIIANAAKGEDAELEIPGMVDLAFMIYHETGLVPVVDLEAESENQ